MKLIYFLNIITLTGCIVINAYDGNISALFGWITAMIWFISSISKEY